MLMFIQFVSQICMIHLTRYFTHNLYMQEHARCVQRGIEGSIYECCS